jgi:hypothetical protein
MSLPSIYSYILGQILVFSRSYVSALRELYDHVTRDIVG